ncbi:MAG: DUF2723 domain-containing protein [Kiritimatiellae bacterium]|nr:DUF2723 domain-containing protein [Kiritimatiellia bacterium]
MQRPDTSPPRAKPEHGLTALAFLLPLAVYLRTMAPTLYGLDSAELTAGARLLGIVHSPGCPLYLLLGRLFCLLPVGDVGYRMNLMSGVIAAGAVSLLFACLRRWTGRPGLSLAAALLLAFSYYYWVWAVVAEIYAVHSFFVALLLYLLTRWDEHPRPARLAAAAFVFGAGLGNHVSLILMLPGMAWWVLAAPAGAGRRPRALLAAAAGGLAGVILVFAYLPLRHRALPPMDYVRDYFPEVDLATLPGLAWMISGGMFRTAMGAVTPAAYLHELRAFLHQAVSNFGVVGIGLAAAGLGYGWRRQPRRQVALGLMLAGHVGFYLTYGAVDKDLMYSAAYLPLAAWAAWGFVLMVRSLEHGHPAPRLVRAIPALLVASLLTFNFRYVDLSRDTSARETGEALLRAMKPDAVFLGMWEHVPILEYLQHVEGRRPDITLHNLVFLGPARGRELVRQALQQNRPVYSTVPEALADGTVEFHALIGSDGYRVEPRRPRATAHTESHHGKEPI